MVSRHDYAAMRQAMVASQLRTNNVNDPAITAAIGAVPREDYVPADLKPLAYIDRPLPLANGRMLNTPLATARMISEAGVGRTDKVLLIGAATGYAAAILSQLASEVVALEEDEAVSSGGASASMPNVRQVRGSLNAGWPEFAPYSLIMIDGAVESVPQAIVDQLAPNGRLVSAVNENGVIRLAIGTRSGAGLVLAPFADAEAAILPGFARSEAFTF